MLPRRSLAFVPLLICLFGGIALAQEEAREWTDIKGQKMSAKFLMLTPDQKLVLEAEGKTYFIPLDRFSQEDQDYVKALEDKPMPDADTSPSPPSGTTPSSKPENKENLTENRQWTDFQGRQVKARYLRMHEGRVILMQGSTPRPVSFYTLSQEDQEWLRERLEERGEADQILTREAVEMFHPNIHDAMEAALALRPETDSSSTPSGTSSGPTSETPSRPPAYMPPDAEPYKPSAGNGPPQGQAVTNSDSTTQRRPLFLPPEQEQPSTGPNDFGGTAPTATTAPDSQQVAANTVPGTGMQPAATSDSSSGFRSRFDQRSSGVPPGHCPNCRKELPQGIGPGDHCPRCRFYLDESVSPGTGPPVEPWYKRYNLVMIGGIAVVVIGALTVLSKKLQG